MAPASRPQIVVVTGASAGVGRAVVQAFARRGAHLGLVARDEARLAAAVREVEALGGRALALPVDVADHDALAAAAERVETEFGPIDVWVNDAMTTILAAFHEITPEEYRRVTEVTYLGFVHGTMVALKHMRPRDRGMIVQVGSALAYRGIPLQAAYCGAKHAMKGFTESLRAELKHAGSRIHVGMVHLPGMNTPQFDWCRTRFDHHPQPVPPIFQPEVAARAVMHMVDHPRREILVGGSTVQTVWGNKLLPGVVEWYLARTAFDGQRTGERIPDDRPDNMFAPVAGDFAAHGSFDDRAKTHSWQQRFDRHRALTAAGALVVLALVVFGIVALVS